MDELIPLFVGVGLVLTVVWIVATVGRAFKSVGGAVSGTSAPPPKPKPRHKTPDWLELEVNRVLDGRLVGGAEPWRSDSATDRQLERLKDHGLVLREGVPTKGEASDLIGLFEDVEPEQRQQIKFYGETLAHNTQTHARALLHHLTADPAKQRQWDERPPDADTRQEAKFYGIKLAKGVTNQQAKALISDFEKDEANEPLVDEWYALVDIFDETTDRETADDYECKKATRNQTIKAVESLQQAGHKVAQLDIEQVFDRLKELYPSLDKA